MATLSTLKATLATTRFPVVVLSEHGALNDGERAQLLSALFELLDRPERHAIIMDLTQGAPLSAAQSASVREHFRRREHDVRSKWAAIAIVVQEPFVSYLPTAMFWIQTAPVPARVFANGSIVAATRWVETLLMDRDSGAISTHVLRGPTRDQKA